jgi:transposase
MNDMKRKNERNSVRTLRGGASMANAMTNPTVAGVDLGDSTSLVTVLSPNGDMLDRFTFQTSQEGYQMLADRLPENAKIACEAMGMVYPFFRAMNQQHGYDVTVANTKELAWISKSKKKNDKTDSLKLAKLHMAGILPEAHLLI